MPRKVVIDTDFGTDADDAIAVALAMASEEIEVQAFTVVGRQSVYRKQMLEDFLSSLGSDCAIPPVYAGWDAPPPVPYGFSLAAPVAATPGPTTFPSANFGSYLQLLGSAYQFNWFGDEGTLDPNSPTRAVAAPQHAGYATFEAGEQLVQLLSQKDVEYIGIGPLTNLYQALTNPTLSGKNISIPQMTIMGVHLQPTLYGKTSKGADNFISAGVDYNLGSDIVSALYVLNELSQAGAKPPGRIAAAKWVTADVTLRTWLSPDQLASLAASQNPFLQALVKIINGWTPIQTNLFKQQQECNSAFLHDPLTLACSFSDDWCDFQPLDLELVLTNNLGLRWIEREQPMSNTIALNCAVSVKTPPLGGQTFQEWLVQRLLDKFP
ncbi:MAG TPA: nucleoside hydrolase [Pyrinomonadaceae bacterium]|nr:nucleoside hydrolase [Pyrinomonadaceae bacterium]